MLERDQERKWQNGEKGIQHQNEQMLVGNECFHIMVEKCINIVQVA